MNDDSDYDIPHESGGEMTGGNEDNDCQNNYQWDQAKAISKFYEMEQLLFKKYLNIITCRLCKKNNNFASAGKAGSKTKQGTQRLHIKCKSCPSAKEGLHKCLERYDECSEDLYLLNNQYEKIQRQGKEIEKPPSYSLSIANCRNTRREPVRSISTPLEVEEEEKAMMLTEEKERNKRKRSRGNKREEEDDDEEEEEEEYDEDNEERHNHNDASSSTPSNVHHELRREIREMRNTMEQIIFMNKRLQVDNERLSQENRMNVAAIEALREEMRRLEKGKRAGKHPNEQTNLPSEKINSQEDAELSSDGDKRNNIESGDNGEKPQSYAEAAKNGPRKKDSKKRKEMQEALKFITPPRSPQTFSKIFMYWNPGKKHKLQGRKEVVHYAYRLLEVLKIRRKVKEMSLIGNSLIELYVAEICLEEIKSLLTANKVRFCTELDRSVNTNIKERETATNEAANINNPMINRIAHLLSRHHILKLRECILEGFDLDTKKAMLIREEEIRSDTNHPSRNQPPTSSNKATSNHNVRQDKGSRQYTILTKHSEEVVMKQPDVNNITMDSRYDIMQGNISNHEL